MGLYAKYIFPPLMDYLMRQPHVMAERQKLVSQARGKVLEVGFGTGLNLEFYSAEVTSLTAVDPCEMLSNRVQKRLSAVSISVERIAVSAESLPLEDSTFDTVVTTWTLCSISDAAAALREIRRVLAPTGKYVFIEHGRSDTPSVARWQDRLNPLQQVLACGCNLNRRIDQLIESPGLVIERLDRFVLPHTPRILGETYCGVARPLKEAE